MRRLGTYIGDVFAPALVAGWIAWLGWSAVAGAAGLQALSRLNAEIEVEKAGLAEILARRERLELRADLLSPKSLDPDIVDERIRSVLGYAREGDIVIPRAEIDRLLSKKAPDILHQRGDG
jgi:cell division protein FtsB